MFNVYKYSECRLKWPDLGDSYNYALKYTDACMLITI